MELVYKEKEQKIRKQWLISWYSKFLYELIVGACAAASSKDAFLGMLLSALFCSGIYGVIYYFSLEKNGFRLLYLVVFFTMVEIFRNLAQSDSLLRLDTKMEGLLVVTYIAIHLWWCFTSVRLSNLNRKLSLSQNR